jgi:hypothetical protein
VSCGDDGQPKETSCDDDEGCQGGKCGSFPKYVFVTSQTYSGNLGGLDGADRKCRDLAAAAPLPGTYKAYLADATGDVSTRFNLQGGPFYMKHRNGDQFVARDWNDVLNGALSRFLNRDERGEDAPFASLQPDVDETFCGRNGYTAFVWSNLTTGGKLADRDNHCANWTSSTISGAPFGARTDTSRWKYDCTMGSRSRGTDPKYCSTRAPLICIQQ